MPKQIAEDKTKKVEYFSIARIKIALKHTLKKNKMFFDSSMDAFRSNEFECPDILFELDTESPFPSLNSYKEIFTTKPSGGLWSIFEDIKKSHYLISLQTDVLGEHPYKIITTDRKFTRFKIFYKPNSKKPFAPLEYPLDELAVASYVYINKIGVLLHSACISIDNKAYLFAGSSSAGKSTISNIWQEDISAEVITDERVIIREIDGKLWAFGTPWHGTAGIHKNIGAPIEKIFFISHGKENRARLLSKTDAASRLITLCISSLWNKERAQEAIDFCIKTIDVKTCYELKFVPNHSITEYLRGN